MQVTETSGRAFDDPSNRSRAAVHRLPGAKVAARLVGLALTILLCGCSAQLAGTPPDSEAENTALKRRLLEMERQSRVSEVEIARLRQQVESLQAELEDARRRPAVGSPSSLAPEPFPSADSPPPVRRSEPVAEIEASDLEEVDLLPPPSEVTLQRQPTAQIAELDPVGREAQELYDGAYTLYHQGEYAAAEQMFGRFLERYPATDLSDNALFWIGESRYARGEYDTALSAFYQAVERYPTGNKVADAMLKAGKCLENLQDTPRARETYQEVVSRFPDSVAATIAAERLASLR